MKNLINLETYGFRELEKALKTFEKDLREELRELIKRIATTAYKIARELAPHKTGLYRKSIKKDIISNLRARIVAVRELEGESESQNHGYLGGLIEYGKKSNKQRARPHIEPAIVAALRIHEKDMQRIMDILADNLEDF